MRKSTYIILLIILLISIPIAYYFAIDTAVSIKYETELNECISRVSGIDLCLQYDIYLGMTYFFTLSILLLLIFYKKIVKSKPKKISNTIDLNQAFDELKLQFEKGLTISEHKSGTRYFGLEKVKEWKSKFGYTFNIYSNDHFINNKPHFHFDHKEKGIACKMSFDGEIFENNGKNEIDRKILKEIKYFLSLENIQKTIIDKWNEKNPKLKYK